MVSGQLHTLGKATPVPTDRRLGEFRGRFWKCYCQYFQEDNIKIDLQEVGGGRGDWMKFAQDRDRWRALVGTVRDFRVP